MAIHETAPVPTTLQDSGGDELLIDANGALAAVPTGPDGTQGVVTHDGSQQVQINPASQTAFGGVLVGETDPVLQISFPYSINPDIVSDLSNNGGSLTQANSMAVASTGAGANQSSGLITNQQIRYEPGIGIRARFSGKFTTGVANSSQVVGLGCMCECLGFGYDGTAFGILHRRFGKFEMRTLTVSTGSSTAENITITLDGDAEATVAVTNTGDVTLTANEIAAHDYSDVGRGWFATAVGDRVVFQSFAPASRTGTYTLSGATTAVGTFAQSVAGATPTETWVPQASWNTTVDKFDGAGASGITLDPTKGNVFQITYPFLGFGPIKFFVQDPEDGELHLVHTLPWGNTNTRPSTDNPTFPLYMEAVNTTNTSDIAVSTASMAAFIDGLRETLGVNKGVSATKTLAAATEEPVLTIRMRDVYQSEKCRSQFKLNLVNASVNHNKPCGFKFYLNATLTGASFTDLSTANSAIEVDTSATAISGGQEVFNIPLGPTGNQSLNLLASKVVGEFSAGMTLTVTCDPLSGTGAEATASFNLTERL